jgi:tetratricopeptide (TPR) repeat protein
MKISLLAKLPSQQVLCYNEHDGRRVCLLNKELQRWMIGSPFQINGFTTENKTEWTNEKLFFPIVGLTTANKANGFPLIPPKRRDEYGHTNVLTTVYKERSDDLSFPVATLITVKKAIEAPDELPVVLMRKKTEKDDELYFPVAVLAISEKADEISELHIPSEGGRLEEIVLESSISEESFIKIIDDISYQQNILPQSEEAHSYNEPLSAIKEEIAAQESDIGGLIDRQNIEEDSVSVEAEESSDRVHDESGSHNVEAIGEDTNGTKETSDQVHDGSSSHKTEAANEDVKETVVPDEPVKSENIDLISDEELARSYEEKKERAAAFAEEYRNSRKLILEHNGKIRKNHIIWLGAGFVSVLILTIACVLFFYSRREDPAAHFNPAIIARDNVDRNADDLVVHVSDSDDLSGKSFDIAANDFVDGSKTSDEVISSDLGKIAFIAEAEKPSLSSDAGVDQTNMKNTASSGSPSIDIIIAYNTGDKEKTAAQKIVNRLKEISNVTTRAAVTANETRKMPVINTAKLNTDRKATTDVHSTSVGSPVKSTKAYSSISVDSTQNSALTAIKNERYIEAIELSKGNLERNPNDRLSFFSLGVALYATLDFSGAAKAFYACLTLDSHILPDFMVEEFDSTESLENLFINYPGVESLIRSVELNPQNKSLYLNLFLSNLKSESPRETSEIYYAILNHAEKLGLNKTK